MKLLYAELVLHNHKRIVYCDMQKNIIVATTKSFPFAAENTEVKSVLEKRGYKIILLEKLNPPFSFDPAYVKILVAGDLPLPGREIDYFPNLVHVARFGVGYDCIDRDAALRRGIIVTNVPAVSAREVAEHAVTLLITLIKDIAVVDRRMKQGIWERTRHGSIAGQKLGIIGLGKIGKETAIIARLLGMDVSAFDEVYDNEFLETHGIQKKSFLAIVAESDCLSLHLPLTETTRHLLNRDAFSRMKRGMFIVNTSRGEVIDEQALLEALDSGIVAGAGLDVFSKEPPFSDPILGKLALHPRVITTPHNASFSPQVQFAVARRVLRNILAVLENRPEELDRVI